MLGTHLSAISASTVILLSGASAHPPYDDLVSPVTGQPCCGVEDCRPAEHRSVPGGDELLYEDKWWPIDPRVVIDGAIDHHPGWHACKTPDDEGLRCVIRPGVGA